MSQSPILCRAWAAIAADPYSLSIALELLMVAALVLLVALSGEL